MFYQVIRIEIRGEGLGDPRDIHDLSDLLDGIDDGEVDAEVVFLD